MNDLKERVDKFNCLELPGQPNAIHMGTMYLVNDLWREIDKLRADKIVLRQMAGGVWMEIPPK